MTANNRFQLGLLGVTMLVLLRITIGWHFLYSGIWKYQNPDFSSEGFLAQAKGPVGEMMKEAILADRDVEGRLDSEANAKGLEEYAAKFADHYSLSDEQRELVDIQRRFRQNQIDEYLAENADAINEYRMNEERLRKAKLAPTRNIPFEQKRLWDNQQALSRQVGEWLKYVDGVWNDFKTDLHAIPDASQREQTAVFEQPLTRLAVVDQIVLWTNIAIGVCLIVGLFTRFAAFSGAIFLASIVAAAPDWPGLYPPPHPSAGRSLIVNKEFIEMMALFTLAATPVGRWGGLDFFVHHLITRPLFCKRDRR